MKRIVYGCVATALCVSSVLPFVHRRRQDVIRADTKVGSVNVGNMTVDDAAKALRVWWEAEKLVKLKVSCPLGNLTFPDMKPSEIGVTLDGVASVKNLPIQGANEPIGSAVTNPASSFPPVFKLSGETISPLANRLRMSVGKPHPARVHFVKGSVVREHEVSTIELDSSQIPLAVAKAILKTEPVELPLKQGSKSIPDDQVDQIREVISEYSTRFPAWNRPRCSNIRLAAHLIDGTVLLPGQKFSFNGVVGRRTVKAGFQLAGVYINGQHDTGIGGGICQVSTTLYNSALLADLPIYRRSNHSLPVPYVPLGRDATVDYGNLDLVFENFYSTPIALTSEYHPGKLVFRILGKKQSGLSVKIVRGDMKWVDRATAHVPDPNLAMGKKVVVKPGSSLRVVQTYRLVFQNGKLVRKESLGHSRYGGQTRIVIVGTKAITNPSPPAVTQPSPIPRLGG